MEAAKYTAQSLYVVYRQLPEEAQRVFKDLLEKEADYTNADWVHLSQPSLDAIWGAPEEDYWDELYAKQHSES
jgi:hypothetical protein